MVTRHTLLVRKLAEIDQLLAGAYEFGDDLSLDTHELFSLFDLIESILKSKRDVEAELAAHE